MSNKEGDPVEVSDLEGFLRKCFNDQKLVLVDVETTRMLPLGENFCSLIVKIDAKVRKSDKTLEEDLHFIAKMINHTDQDFINWKTTLLKELYAYRILIPAYASLEKKLGHRQIVTDLFPKYIGHRYSLVDYDNEDNFINDHSMLVLENLRHTGYYTGNRFIGLDLEHAKVAVSSLAKFHAMGMLLLKNQPNFIDEIISQFDDHKNFTIIDNAMNSVLITFRENDVFNKHMKVIENTFAEAKNGKLWKRTGCKPWATIIHGDFWLNNMMFRKNSQNEVVDYKLIDYQIYNYNSPLKDLPGFLMCSIEETVRTKHLDLLLEHYHKIFLQQLESIGHDTKSFGKKEFDEEIKRQAVIQFPLCALGFKFQVMEINEAHKSSTIACDILLQKTNDKVLEKLKKLVAVYERKDWF